MGRSKPWRSAILNFSTASGETDLGNLFHLTLPYCLALLNCYANTASFSLRRVVLIHVLKFPSCFKSLG